MDRPEKNKDQRTNYMELMVEMMEVNLTYQKNSLNKLTYGKKEVNVGNIHIRSTRLQI
jgi:hypothetical protein